jgi:hypothetical protein
MPSTSFASELKTFNELFDGNMTALDAFFRAVGKGSFRQPRKM